MMGGRSIAHSHAQEEAHRGAAKIIAQIGTGLRGQSPISQE